MFNVTEAAEDVAIAQAIVAAHAAELLLPAERLCRSCGFTHPASVTDCPRWPAEMFTQDHSDERNAS